jgi:predicted O-methyltransferase YrrM
MALAQALQALTNIRDFVTLQHRFEKVRGYLHPLEGYALMLLAAYGEGEGGVVEVGSFMGRSTCWLATGVGVAKRGMVTAVDHFQGSPEHQAGGTHPVAEIARDGSTLPAFRANLAAHGLDAFVTPIVSASLNAAEKWTTPLRLVFIDGDHSYEASRDDFEAWSKFVVPGGLVAFHDIGAWPGVTKYYKELLAGTAGHTGWTEVLAANSLRVVQRGV